MRQTKRNIKNYADLQHNYALHKKCADLFMVKNKQVQNSKNQPSTPIFRSLKNILRVFEPYAFKNARTVLWEVLYFKPTLLNQVIFHVL